MDTDSEQTPWPAGRLLKQLRTQRDFSQETLGKRAGTSRAWISTAENGLAASPPNISKPMLRAWGMALGRTESERKKNVEDLLRAAGYVEPGAELDRGNVPDLAQQVAAEVTKTLRELIDADPRLRRVHPVRHDQQRIPADGTAPMDDVYTDLPLNHDRLVALTVRGHCMEPGIRDGETVIIDTERAAELKDVVAVYLEGDWTLKRLRKRNGVWLLVPDNTDYQPIEIDPTKVRVLGVVVQVSRGKP